MHHPREDGYFIIIVIINQGDILSGGRLAVIINTDDINIHALRKSFIAENHASRKSCIAENSCFAENHALRVNNYARREEFMPRQNLHIARRFYSSLKVMHREKIQISREFTYRGKIFMPRKRTYTDKEGAIFIHRPQLHLLF